MAGRGKKNVARNIRIDQQLDTLIREFCAYDNRDEVDTCRRMWEVFLRDGFAEASRRLRAGEPWDAAAQRPAKSAAEHAADLVPLESDRPKASARGKRGA